MDERINIFTDGGARGNPGPAALGVYIENGNGKEITSFGRKIGEATNNAAEYSALIAALDWVIENKNDFSMNTKINFFLDSKLVCSQVLGIFKIKNEGLKSLLLDVRDREGQINLPLFYQHIPREKNRNADKMVNQALDGIA